jgi:hypothetical protein
VEHTFHQDFIQQQIQLDKLSAEAQYTPASEPLLSPPSAAVPHAPRTAPQGAEDPDENLRCQSQGLDVGTTSGPTGTCSAY